MVTLPKSVQFRQHLKGALYELTQEQNWEQFGDLSPEDEAEMWSKIVSEITDVPTSGGGEVPIGAMLPYLGNVVPENWLICQGQALSGDEYPELRDACPAYFNQQTNLIFLPDMRARVPVGYDTPSYPVGYQGGEWMHQLTVTEMPYHTHKSYWTNSSTTGGLHNVGNTNGRVGNETQYDNVESVGGNQSHNNMPPFHIVPGYIIRVKNDDTP